MDYQVALVLGIERACPVSTTPFRMPPQGGLEGVFVFPAY
jgi:hypothetical protein